LAEILTSVLPLNGGGLDAGKSTLQRARALAERDLVQAPYE
jgi:hypothetical protein